MERANVHRWSESEIIRLTLDDGTVAYGETIQNYTWGRVEDTDRVIGQSPFDLMWDDSLGAGLQMALFDAAGKLAGVPVHRLLGPKVRGLVSRLLLGPRYGPRRLRTGGPRRRRTRVHLHQDQDPPLA